MKFDKKPGCMFLIWCCRNYLLSFFFWKNVACLKHCIPEGNWKIPEGFPEGELEGKSQYAKHCIPEGNRKIPEGYPEEILEGKIVFFTLFYIFSCLTWLGSPSKVLTQVLKGSESLNAAQKGGVKWFTFLCFFVQLLKEKSKKHEGSCENTESRKATGRSRKVTRKESRKDNFGN